MNDKECNKTAKYFINLITEECLSKFTTETNADFHARKLKVSILLEMMIYGKLAAEKGSQRDLCRIYESHYFKELFPLVNSDSLTHVAISKRLRNVNVDFFASCYDALCKMADNQFEPEDSVKVIAVDSTMVRATANALNKQGIGMVSGAKDKNGGSRSQIKYTMGLNSFKVLYGAVHTTPRYLSEDYALGEAVLSITRNMPKDGKKPQKDIFAFDRGLKSGKILNEIADENAVFVARINLNRVFRDKQDFNGIVGELPQGASLKSDEIVSITSKTDSLKSTTHQFRIISVDMGREFGIRKGTKHRSEHILRLITDDLDPELTVREIMDIYAQRWKIELFFRFLKQELDFSHIMSYSENGLVAIMYVCLITALLVKMYAKANHCGIYKAVFYIRLEIVDTLAIENKKLKQRCLHGHVNGYNS